MYFLKALFIAITVAAVTTSPVVASLKSCCCSLPAERTKSCCRSAPDSTRTAKKSCCAKRAVASNGIDPQVSKGCCCVKAPESATVSDRLAVPDVEKPSLDLAFLNEDRQRKLLSLLAVGDESPGRFTLSGPSLLALYCTWLK
jgi:hypothetical protein